MKNILFQNYSITTVIALSLALLVLLFLVYNKASPTKKSQDTLIVGMMSGWAPFMTITTKGTYEGFDVDVAQELAERMGKRLMIKDLGSLPSCFVALEQKKIDLLLSGLDITKKRLQTLEMVRYTGEEVTSFSLIFWNTIPKQICSLQDMRRLPNAVICAEIGSAQEAFLDQFSSIVKKGLASVVDIVLDLKFGKSLAALVEPRVAARLKRQNSEIKHLEIPLPEGFQVYGCGIAVKKDNSVLTAQVISLVSAMRLDGTLKKLEQKWQLEE